MNTLFIRLSKALYRILRPIFFLIDSETIHSYATSVGEFMGSGKILKRVIGKSLVVKSPSLAQTFYGVQFENPIGLAAGFDYEARLTQILPSLGFGFGTVGTV